MSKLTATPNEGIYHDVEWDEYVQIGYPSCHALQTLITSSPAQVLYNRDTAPEPSAAMLRGSATDALVLRGDDYYNAHYAVVPDGMVRNPRHKKYQEWLAEHGDKIALTEAEHNLCYGMRDALLFSEQIESIINNTRHQVCIIWREPNTDMLVKSLLDMIDTDCGMVVDLKTCRSVTYRDMQRDIANYKYHWQAAMYIDAAQASLGQPYQFALVCVKNTPVHSTAIYTLSDDAIAQGRREYQDALRTWAQCADSDYWPSSVEHIQEINLPRWAMGEHYNPPIADRVYTLRRD